MSGPLSGVVVAELAGLGPAPFCGMVLADLGADVIRVDRIDATGMVDPNYDLHNRGKRSIALDLKSDVAREIVLKLVSGSDAVVEGFRPGVTERLGIGPDVCLASNPQLTYARVTGWGQHGPWSDMAGHDIDYIAISGVLGSVGTADQPSVPLNLVGDFGGGGMLAALGVLAGVINARAGGVGQVVDVAMVDGSALLMTSHHGFMAEGWWSPERSSNLLDGAAPFYRVYETADHKHVAVGALEPQFFTALLDGLNLDRERFNSQNDRALWPAMGEAFATIFRTRTRDEWADHFAGSDACVAPVLSMQESKDHVHISSRQTFVEVNDVYQPSPAPRFGETPASIDWGPPSPGSHTGEVLTRLGYSDSQIGMLRDSGAVA